MDAQPFTPRPHPRGYVCLRASSPPAIDGRVQGAGWDSAPWTDEFLDIEGPTKPHPYHSTRVKMLWDDDALYVGAWMDEPQPWANLKLHNDIIYKDNDFEVFIDPDGDNHQYYEFEINAINTLWDLFLVKPYRDGGPALMSFESISPSEPSQVEGPTGWLPVRRAVWVDGNVNDPSVTSKGWGVTMAFPWSLLEQAAHRDCPPNSGDQWRINFSRVQWDVVWDTEVKQYVKQPPNQAEKNWVWSPQWAIAMHQPEYWGYVQFQGNEGPPEPFIPDHTWIVRSFLMEVYYRQKSKWEKEGVYSPSLTGLDLTAPPALANARVLVQTTEVSFIATAQVPTPDGKGHMRLYVNEEGRITHKNISTPVEA